jgi:hypothetical protein
MNIDDLEDIGRMTKKQNSFQYEWKRRGCSEAGGHLIDQGVYDSIEITISHEKSTNLCIPKMSAKIIALLTELQGHNLPHLDLNYLLKAAQGSCTGKQGKGNPR